MSAVLVVGDDLTGSNAVGALYATQGLTAVTVSTLDAASRLAANTNVLVFNTESRHQPPDKAASLVHDVVAAVGEQVSLIAKRVDTTLRGNLGAEVMSLLTTCRQANPDRNYRVLMVPAFPASGRVTIGGMQFVDDVPVSESWAGHDPLGPVVYSRVAQELARQANLTTVEAHLDSVRAGTEALAADLVTAGGQADVVIVDAISNDDLRTIATAAAAAEQSGIIWLAVDSGPFGASLASAMGLANQGPKSGSVMVVAGSLTQQTQEQLDFLEQQVGSHLVTIDIDDDPAEIVSQLAYDDANPVIGVRTVIPADGTGDFASAMRMQHLLEEVTRQAVEKLHPVGIYVTGGDIATGVIDALGADGFQIAAEVLPLAVVGNVAGGPHDGLGLSTKGGLIGGTDAALRCVQTLQQRARLTERNPK